MNVMPDNTTEAQLQQLVEDALNLFGWVWFHDRATNHARMNNPGFPDIVAVSPICGYTLVLELKTKRGRLSDAQKVWRDALHKSPVDYRVMRPAHIDEILDVIRHHGARGHHHEQPRTDHHRRP